MYRNGRVALTEWLNVVCVYDSDRRQETDEISDETAIFIYCWQMQDQEAVV